MIVEYLKNILATNKHLKETCIAEKFESNIPLVWCHDVLKVDG